MKILVIATCFAPKNIIGAVRTSKIVKYLVRAGHDLTVISPVLEDYDAKDMTLECDELKKVVRITVPYSSITTKLTGVHKASITAVSTNAGNKANDSVKAKLYRILRNGFSSWRDYEWTRKAKKTVRSLGNFDFVISSYPYVAAHDVAAYAKSSGKTEKWIADFRDPLALEGIKGREHENHVKKQSQIVHLADKTVYVTQAGVKNFTCLPEDKHKIVWIPNGYDKDDFFTLQNITNDEEKSRQLCFSYAGGMYHGERDCSPLFKAIKQLIEKGVLDYNSVKFRYAGTDFRVLEDQASRYNLISILENEGKISRSESLNMQYTSDCVVVATFCYRDGEGSIPGKVYEPLMMKKPILMLVSGSGHNCEAASFVDRLGAGCSYVDADDQGDVERIRTFIMDLVADKNSGHNRFLPSESDLKPYQYETIANKMIEIITEGD